MSATTIITAITGAFIATSLLLRAAKALNTRSSKSNSRSAWLPSPPRWKALRLPSPRGDLQTSRPSWSLSGFKNWWLLWPQALGAWGGMEVAGPRSQGLKRRPMSVVPGVSYASCPHTHNLCNAQQCNFIVSRVRDDQCGQWAKLIQALRLASVLFVRISTIVELRSEQD